jgi:hypothetical protein
MAVDSFGRYGDVISLTSPKSTVGQRQEIVFEYFVQQKDANSSGSLQVYILSEEKVPKSIVLNKEQNKYNMWTRVKYMITQEERIYVMFVATLGLPLVSSVMIKNVMMLTGDKSENYHTHTQHGKVCHL